MKKLLLALFFSAFAVLTADAASLRAGHVPFNGGRAPKEKPAKPLDFPPAVNTGDILTTPRDVYVFASSEDAKTYAAMNEQSKEDAATWAAAKEGQKKAMLQTKGSKLVVKDVRRDYVSTPILYPSVGNGSGYEQANAAARAQHDAAVLASHLNAVLVVETMDGKRCFIVRKLMLAGKKKKKH